MRMPRKSEWVGWCVLAATFHCLTVAGWGQPIPTNYAPPRVDPLLNLMMTQPPIDVVSSVAAEAEFDPPVVQVGGDAVYRVMLNSLEESVQFPTGVPAPDALHLRKGASGHFLQSGGGRITPRATFLFHARPTTPGQFTIPAFVVTAYGQPVTVPATTLRVVTEPPANATPPQRVLLQIPKRTYYVGENIPVRLLLPSGPTGRIQPLMSTRINADDVIVDRQQMVQRVVPTTINGRRVTTFTYETVAIPIRAGEVTLTGQGFVNLISTASRQQIRTPQPRPAGTPLSALTNTPTRPTPVWQPPRAYMVDSEPVTLQIAPLPVEPDSAVFTGAIGVFTLDEPVLSTNTVRAGEPVTLTVVIRGDGNLDRFVPPPMPGSMDWQTFPPTPDPAQASTIRQRRYNRFSYTAIPLHEGVTMTPEVPLWVFNPIEGQYEDLTLPSLPITVKPPPPGTDPMAAQLAAAAWMEEEEQKAKELKLAPLTDEPGSSVNDLAPRQGDLGFLTVQFLPVLGIAALWGWDRRRRFLEHHPDIVIRRRARRAVRRHLRRARRAAASGDAQQFLSDTLAALREASAPTERAHPLALTCRDVVQDLPTVGLNGESRDLVVQLFDVADGRRFGGKGVNELELLKLHDQAERLLTEWVERL